MAELIDRDAQEAVFLKSLEPLTKAQRDEALRLMGFPPDVKNIPESKWRQWEDERAAVLLLLLMETSASAGVQSGLSGARSLENAERYAQQRAVQLSRQYFETTRKWLESRTVTITETAARQQRRITQTEVKETTGSVFSRERDENAARTETTAAQHHGGESAVNALGLQSDLDTWITHPEATKSGVCPVCAPLHGTRRKVWSKKFPAGPPAHVKCACEVVHETDDPELVEKGPPPLEDFDLAEARQSAIERRYGLNPPAPPKPRDYPSAEQPRPAAEIKPAEALPSPPPKTKAPERPDPPPAIPVERGEKTAEEVRELARARLPQGLDPDRDIPKLVGAQPGAKVEYYTYGKDNILVKVEHPDYTAERTLTRDPQGKVEIINEKFTVAGDKQGRGTGLQMFSDQVEQAAKAGATTIHANADRNDARGVVGYKVWPKMGYDAPLPEDVKRKLPPELKGAKTVLDLYESPEGVAYWEQHGEGIDVTFDLSAGSRSREVLDAYRARKGLPPLKKTLRRKAKAKGKAKTAPAGEHPDLSDDDEQTLAEVWAERRARDGIPFQEASIQDKLGLVRAAIRAGAVSAGGRIRGIKPSVEEVQAVDLLATQRYFIPPAIAKYVGDPGAKPHGGERPQVVMWKGQLFIWDGHHRAVAAALRGEKLLAEVYAI